MIIESKSYKRALLSEVLLIPGLLTKGSGVGKPTSVLHSGGSVLTCGETYDISAKVTINFIII